MKGFKGIKTGDITAKISSSGIIFAKTGNPNHLTVCFNLRLNALDIHFTNEKINEKPDIEFLYLFLILKNFYWKMKLK